MSSFPKVTLALALCAPLLAIPAQTRQVAQAHTVSTARSSIVMGDVVDEDERVARALRGGAVHAAGEPRERRFVDADAAALDALQRVTAEADGRRLEPRVEDLGERAGARRRLHGRPDRRRAGGLGAVEVALSGALTTFAQVPGAYAVSAVLLFRLLTFWLPIPLGWAAMNYLQRHEAL